MRPHQQVQTEPAAPRVRSGWANVKNSLTAKRGPNVNREHDLSERRTT